MSSVAVKKQQAFASGQLKLRLDSPLEHLQVLHHDANVKRRGHVILFLPGRKQQWLKLPSEHSHTLIRQVRARKDVYVAVNRFFGWRRTELLCDMCALYAELDIDLVPGTRHTKASRGEVTHDERLTLVAKALSALESARIPPPTLIVYSAGGPHLYWIFKEATSPKALPRWQYLQDRVIKALHAAGCGVDLKAKDAARVLREIGSKHGATGLQITGEVYGPHYDFDWLHDEIAEFTRTELRDLRVERAKRGKDIGERRQNTGQKSIYSWWHTVYRDLLTIINYHWFGGIPKGYRDEMLFLLGTALSWFAQPETLTDEIAALARQWTPTLSEKEALSYASSVIKRAQDAAAGIKYKWTKPNGSVELVDPRYRFKSETLYDRLQPLIPDELLESLHAIGPREHLKARKNANDKARITAQRRAAGIKPMADIQTQSQSRLEQITTLRNQGLKWDDIGQRLGISGLTARVSFSRGQKAKKGTAM